MFEEYGDYITKIATHIAKFGLSPEPIVILNDKKNWSSMLVSNVFKYMKDFSLQMIEL